MFEHLKVQQGDVIAKIHVISKKPFFWIRRDKILKKWLREEKISLEENNLEALYITRIGFLTNCWPRDAFGKLFVERLKAILGRGCPEFTCYSDTLKIGEYTARFMMIKTANKDANNLMRQLKSKENQMTEQFIPWKTWMAMVEGRKASLVEKQENL
jgi:hypothetical protein